MGSKDNMNFPKQNKMQFLAGYDSAIHLTFLRFPNRA
jgi:hypothetical protein